MLLVNTGLNPRLSANPLRLEPATARGECATVRRQRGPATTAKPTAALLRRLLTEWFVGLRPPRFCVGDVAQEYPADGRLGRVSRCIAADASRGDAALDLRSQAAHRHVGALSAVGCLVMPVLRPGWCNEAPVDSYGRFMSARTREQPPTVTGRNGALCPAPAPTPAAQLLRKTGEMSLHYCHLAPAPFARAPRVREVTTTRAMTRRRSSRLHRNG